MARRFPSFKISAEQPSKNYYRTEPHAETADGDVCAGPHDRVLIRTGKTHPEREAPTKTAGTSHRPLRLSEALYLRSRLGSRRASLPPGVHAECGLEGP